jgi:transposase-like protein
MSIRRELIDELLKDYPNPQDVLAEDGLLKQLTKAVIERCLETELDGHLGYPKHGSQGRSRQHAQRHEPENGQRRAGPVRDRGAAGPAGHL